MKTECLFLVALIALAARPAVVLGQDAADAWPIKPVTIIVPLSPGAAVDIETRLYAQKLAQSMGRNFIVDYKPGAGTTIGLGHVAKSPPDGYSLVAITASATIATLAYPNLTFDPIKDLALVSLMTAPVDSNPSNQVSTVLRTLASQLKLSFSPGSGHCITSSRSLSDSVTYAFRISHPPKPILVG